jgi:quercetin dioxygenase-like cupin family protein
MNFKIISWAAVLFFSAMQASHQSVVLAEKPYAKDEAWRDLIMAGYNMTRLQFQDLTLKGNSETGANFYDGIISNNVSGATDAATEIRMVCYGPGNYVKAHHHDEDEIFHVTRGGCKVWKLFVNESGKSRWHLETKKMDEIIKIDKNVVHALVALEKGLCMHVNRNDMTRSVNFVDVVQPWQECVQDGHDLEISVSDLKK